MMRTFYVPIENAHESTHKNLIWLPHVILKSSRGRYLVNAYLLEKIKFAPRKSLLISPYPEKISLGHPSELERGSVVDLPNLDFDNIIDDLEKAYIESLEISKSKAYRRAKYWGRLDLVRILLPTGIYKLFSKENDDVLAEECREASYAMTIFKETIFWKNERPTAEGIVYVPLFIIKGDNGILVLDNKLKKNRIIVEILRKEEKAKEAILNLVETH